MIFGAPKGQAHTKHVLWREDMLPMLVSGPRSGRFTSFFLNGVERWVW